MPTSLQDPPKSTQIWIFGLKKYHLATLQSEGAAVAKHIYVLELNPCSELTL
jgi:hypothetical protein